MAYTISIKLVMMVGYGTLAFGVPSLLQKYSPDFDLSLGKGNRYYNTYYKNRLSLRSKTLELFRELYEKNKLLNIKPFPTLNIPRIIHQIWLGSPLPDRYKKWQATWQNWPGWEYKLWTDKDVKELQLVNREFFEAAKTYGQKADLLRIELLNQFGGLYVDMDFECLNPELFTLLHRYYDFYTGITPVDCSLFGVNNAIIGSVKGHPILEKYIHAIRKNWYKPTTGSYSEVVLKTGPGLFTTVFMKYAGKTTIDIALPPSLFYPLGLRQGEYLQKYFENVKRAAIKPESAAIHWWTQSWKKKAKKKKAFN